MWKFVLVVMSFIGVSCSNFALPEKIHVKAGINPNLPINSASFNFSEKFQNELSSVFSESGGTGTNDDAKMRVFNYTGDTTSEVQKFLISFSMKEQSLDFQEYLGMELNDEFDNINQTFKVEATPKKTTIAIDMNNTMQEILGKITLNPPVSIPVGPLPTSTPLSRSLPVEGFNTLSFHNGKLLMKFTIPAGTPGTVNLTNLTVNEIPSDNTTYVLTGTNNTQEVSFEMANRSLTPSLALALSYTAVGTSAGDLMTVDISFSNTTKIKTVSGVMFNTVNGDFPANNTINLDLDADFVQATIGAGTIAINADNLKGVNIDLSQTTIKQEETTAADYKGIAVKKGLDLTGLNQPQTPLAGNKINGKDINIGGPYKLESTPNSEITFTQDGKVNIDFDIVLQNFSLVYINATTMIDDFNKSKDASISHSLDDLKSTVNSIEMNKAGVDLIIEESNVTGLTVDITSSTFDIGTSPKPVLNKGDTLSFVNDYIKTQTNTKTLDVKNSSAVEFKIALGSTAAATQDPIFELTNVDTGKDQVIFKCKPELVFDWDTAKINPDNATNGGNSFTTGSFPQNPQDSISLGGTDLNKILKGIQFEKDINAYLFLSGPTGLNSGNDISLTLKAYSKDLYNDKIAIVHEMVKLPEDGKPYDDNIEDKEYSHKTVGDLKGPIDFTETFNTMLAGTGLTISYDINFGSSGMTIKRSDIENSEIKAFKADLVVVIPLKLVPDPASNKPAEINLKEYMGGLIGDNLLSFTEDADISIETLTLNVTLTGSALTAGAGAETDENAQSGIIIERLASDGATDIRYREKIFIPLSSSNVSIPLTDYLGPTQKLTPTGIGLQIGKGGSLKVTPDLSLVSIGVNAAVDATIDLF
jgi:hypothetical protein